MKIQKPLYCILPILVSVVFCFATTAADSAPPAANSDLTAQVQKLFEAKCRECHHPETKNDTPYLHAATTLAELVEGEAVTLGDIENSLLMERISRNPNSRGRMPRSRGQEGDKEYRTPLSAEEISLVKSWIAGQKEEAPPKATLVPPTAPTTTTAEKLTGTPDAEKKEPRPATFAAAAKPQDAMPEGLALEEQVRFIFKKKCQSCHNPDDVHSPDLNFPLEQLISKTGGKKSLAEQIIARVSLPETEDGFMPEDGEKLSEKEITLLKSWFASKQEEKIQRKLISQNDVLKTISDDIRKDESVARNYRYFTLANLHNVTETTEGGGEGFAYYDDKKMDTFRAGISLLINSLSMGGRVVQPLAIDQEKTIYRINLHDYQWEAGDWERVVNFYPHGILGANSRLEKYINEKTHSRMAFLRADWFVFAAAQPPLYDDILDKLLGISSPNDEHIQQQLEKALAVDRVANLQRGHAVRAGLFDSGVSDHNRLIERHASAYGAYWVSYDFKHRGASDAQDLRKAPLGPREAILTGNPELVFAHDGGEMIYNLPNGLQGYLLATADGKRLDSAPTEVVRSNRGDGTIITGIACIGCHDKGMKPAVRYSEALGDMEDKLRPVVEESNLLGGQELARFQKLHAEKKEFQRLINLDAERFMDAKKQAIAGFQTGAAEPVTELYEAYHLDRVTSRRLAAEFGIEHGEMMDFLEDGLLDSDSFRTTYYSLKNGGAEPREQMLQQFLRVAFLLNFHLLPFEPLGYEEFEGEKFAELIRNDPLFIEAFGKGAAAKAADYAQLQQNFKATKEKVGKSEASLIEQATSSVLLPGGSSLAASVNTEVKIGGEGTLSLVCDRDLHLRILIFSADGKIKQFYPNATNPESLVPFSQSGGKAFNIPFEAIANDDGQIGAEYFHIYASFKPLEFKSRGVQVAGFTEYRREEIFSTRGAVALKAGFGTKIPKVTEDSQFLIKQENRIFETKVGYVLRK